MGDLFHKWQMWMMVRGSAEIIPRRVPGGRLERYNDRFILLKLAFFALNLHHFRASDPDVPHDHPWWNVSFIVHGIVDEVGADGRTRRLKRFRPYFRKAGEFHRLVLISDDAWSLFFHGRHTRQWGFMDWERGYWTPAPEFLAKHRLPTVPAHPKVRYGFFAKTTYPGHGHYFKDVLDRISLERNTTFV